MKYKSDSLVSLDKIHINIPNLERTLLKNSALKNQRNLLETDFSKTKKLEKNVHMVRIQQAFADEHKDAPTKLHTEAPEKFIGNRFE